MTKRILAVDDDPSIRELVSDLLTDNGYAAVTVENGAQMEAVLATTPVDLVILDVRLPGDDGFTLARTLRSRSHLPIIMLTGKDHEVDRVLGLELGADDYLVKPFSPRELLARIRAVLRRHELAAEPAAGNGAAPASPRNAEPRAYQFAGWELNTGTRRLTSPRNERVDLTNSEYSLLVTLLRAPRNVLSRDQLLEGSRMHADIFDRSIVVQILRLRRKIEKNPKEPELIRTERSAGYFLDAEVVAIR